MQILCFNFTPEAAAQPWAPLSHGWEGRVPVALEAALSSLRWGKPRDSHSDIITGQGFWGRAHKAPFIWEVLPFGGCHTWLLCTVPGLTALLGLLWAAWESSGKRAGRRGSSSSQFPPASHPHSHWAFLDRAVGFLLGGGVCDTGVGAVPYQSWSRMSPWQMWRQRELQTVEG